CTDRALAQCKVQTGAQLAARVLNPRAVTLDQRRQGKLDALVGSEALVARTAAAPTADGIAFLGNPGVNDLRVGAAAERALHGELTVNRQARSKLVHTGAHAGNVVSVARVVEHIGNKVGRQFSLGFLEATSGHGR